MNYFCPYGLFLAYNIEISREFFLFYSPTTLERMISAFVNSGIYKKIRRGVLVMTIYLASFDIYTDWGFYIDVVSMRPGLVYGYISNEVVIPLFIVTVLGTILYLFEMIFIFCQLFDKKIEWVKFEYLMTLIMWFDVIPHLVINSFIAACHEYSVSYFQLLRTGVSIASMIIRLIVSVIEYCLEKWDTSNVDKMKEEKTIGKNCFETHCLFNKQIMCHVFTIAGFAVQLIIGAVLFQFTYVQTYSGRFQFHAPKQFFDSQINPERYFNTVNIFLSLGIVNGKYKNHYINIASVYHVIYSQRYGMTCDVRLSVYEAINATNHLGFHFKKNFVNLKGENIVNNKCWSLVMETDTITGGDCSVFANKYVLTTSYIFHIKYISPDSSRQFGIIKYQSLRAIYPEEYKDVKIRLKYFTSDNGGFLSTVLERSSNRTWRWYSLDNLYSVKSIWKTGYAMCESNTNEYPIYVRSRFKL